MNGLKYFENKTKIIFERHEIHIQPQSITSGKIKKNTNFSINIENNDNKQKII